MLYAQCVRLTNPSASLMELKDIVHFFYSMFWCILSKWKPNEEKDWHLLGMRDLSLPSDSDLGIARETLGYSS